MKQLALIFLMVSFIYTLTAPNQPGLHIEENQTVVFGKDTTSAGIKLLWYPSKAALRAGKTNTTEWIQANVGPFSTAFGVDTEARGNYSSALGLSTWALSYGETSVGRFSLGGGNQNSWLATDPLFEVGNGSSSMNRSNAFTVFKNGNAEIQSSLKLGDHAGTSISNGTVRYTGSDIQGRVGGVWRSLTDGSNSGGSTPWSTIGSNIYYNNGNVGIGTSDPIDNIFIFGNNGISETMGISIRNGKTTIPLDGGPPTGPSSTGRIWQTLDRLNMGLADGTSKISFDDSTILLDSPNFSTNWGFNFQHFNANFASTYQRQTWIKKAWRGDLGDYLYLGSTGNRDITNQHAMLLTQSDGIQFGKANTNDGDGLGDNRIKLNFNSVQNSISSTTHLDISVLNNKNVRFFANGTVGGVTIGTGILPSGYRLSIDGKVAAEEILVQLSGLWPDYVFSNDYQLMDLNKLKIYVEENDRLPGVPSATEIADDGIKLGEMQKLQMEKIEELTLYILQLEKRISELEQNQ